MNVEKAIKILRDTGVGTKLDYRYSAETLNAVKKLAIQALQAQAERRWIPVSERLPEERGEYLVTYRPCYWDKVYDEIYVGIDSFRGKTAWAKKKYQRVTHWMPLPEPPKEDCND